MLLLHLIRPLMSNQDQPNHITVADWHGLQVFAVPHIDVRLVQDAKLVLHETQASSKH